MASYLKTMVRGFRANVRNWPQEFVDQVIPLGIMIAVLCAAIGGLFLFLLGLPWILIFVSGAGFDMAPDLVKTYGPYGAFEFVALLIGMFAYSCYQAGKKS